MAENQYVVSDTFTRSETIEFPSLDDSPLWAEDYAAPQQPVYEETPPLIVIRAHYPNMAKSIELMWGEPELDDYFHKLLMGDRQNHVRLPKEVMEAVLRLNADHFKRFKFEQVKRKPDSWSAVNYVHGAIN
jgi:hypothetical protein